MTQSRYIVIGQVLKPFGVKGEMRVRAYTETFEPFERSSVLVLDESPYRVTSVRAHSGALLVSFEGIDTPEEALELRGRLIKTNEENLPPKGEDEYYWFELIGMRVSTVDGRDLGKVSGIIPTGANDVMVVTGPRGEVLLPMIDDVFLEVDTQAETILVDPLEGLMPDA